MNASPKRKSANTEVISKVASALIQKGVAGLPRNYELFYEAFSGANGPLSKQLIALKNNPTQEEIDTIGVNYYAKHFGKDLVENAQEDISRHIDDLSNIMNSGQKSLTEFNTKVNKTAHQIGAGNANIKQIANDLSSASATAIKNGQQLIKSMDETSADISKLKQELASYKKVAYTDHMTQLSNRRAFDEEMAATFKDNKKKLYRALILIDIDFFKKVNDTHGHIVGDKIICLVASIMKKSVRANDFTARIGGEEFAMIIDGASLESVQRIAEQFRKIIATKTVINRKTNEKYGPVTISAGICMASDTTNAEDLYANADRALYASKTNGRNQVTIHNESTYSESGEKRQMYKAS